MINLVSKTQVKEAQQSLIEFLRNFPSLPRSCRAFAHWALAVTLFGLVHSTLLWVGGVQIEATSGSRRANNYYFYASSQLLFSVLVLGFAVSCLMRENSVELKMSLLLGALVLVFDISLLANSPFDDDNDDPSFATTILSRPFRIGYLCAMLVLLGGMAIAGAGADRDFGWRIFKLCGTNVERKAMYDTLFYFQARAALPRTAPRARGGPGCALN